MQWFKTGKDEKVISCTEEEALSMFIMHSEMPFYCHRCGAPILYDDTVREIMTNEAKLYIVCKRCADEVLCGVKA